MGNGDLDTQDSQDSQDSYPIRIQTSCAESMM